MSGEVKGCANETKQALFEDLKEASDLPLGLTLWQTSMQGFKEQSGGNSLAKGSWVQLNA
jgi:hypothetical protein